MAFSLRGIAYITGASSGIGQHAAYSLARQGVRSFALLDRNPVTKTISELKKIAPDVSIKPIELDVANEKAVDDSVEQTVKEFEFERVISVNTTGVWLCQRAQIRQMLKQEKHSDSDRSYRGSIVNTASMYGVVGPSLNVPSTAYTTSKHAVVGLTRADAIAFAGKGIKINALCPGYVATPLAMSSMKKGSLMDDERAKIPLQRLASMQEIGDCVAFLYSEASSYMVGATLIADGGFTIQ